MTEHEYGEILALLQKMRNTVTKMYTRIQKKENLTELDLPKTPLWTIDNYPYNADGAELTIARLIWDFNDTLLGKTYRAYVDHAPKRYRQNSSKSRLENAVAEMEKLIDEFKIKNFVLQSTIKVALLSPDGSASYIIAKLQSLYDILDTRSRFIPNKTSK